MRAVISAAESIIPFLKKGDYNQGILNAVKKIFEILTGQAAGVLAAKSIKEKRKIKDVLMDPKVVAGIGNIYSDEILFHAKVRPARTITSTSAPATTTGGRSTT